MPCVTLLVTGVPRYALLEDLSRHLDLLFDTDEIGTFKLRNLPNHPRTNKRQVALDFRSGFDAMAAQAKLDTFEYEYNGEMYTLYAKINKIKEYTRSDFSPETTVADRHWQWSALRTMSDLSYDESLYRDTHTKLNAHLALLRKEKLIVEAERELLREKRKLKREYGCMNGHDSEHEATSKHRRQRSRGRRSGSRRRRSKSREGHVVRGSKERRTRSRDRSRPHLAWDDRTRQLRSRSKERRSQSHEMHAKDRSRSREQRDLRSLIRSKRAQSTSRERSKSEEKVHPTTSRERPYRDPRSLSRERHYRERRSQSYERDYRDQRLVSREQDRERRSMSRERDYAYIFPRERVHRDRRSSSRSRYTERRSKERAVRRSRSRNRLSESRDRTHIDDVIVLSRSRDYRVQRLRTPERRPLAIMPNPERSEAPREGSLDVHGDANEPPMINVTIFRNEDATRNINYSPTVKNKQVANVPKEVFKHSVGINETDGTVDYTKNQKQNQEKKKLAQFNSKIRKAQQLELKIEFVTYNVKLLVLEILDELILEDKVIISESNKILLKKTLEELVRERVEPLVRVRNDCDISVVLRKYKLRYSKENDVLLIRKMLEDISKKNKSPAVTNTIKETDKTSSDLAGQSTEMKDCSMQESFPGVNKENELQEDGSNETTTEGKENSEITKDSDVDIPKEHTKKNDINTDNLKPCENTINAPHLKGGTKETDGPTIIIDIDSPDKPVPKRPQFYLVIKPLVKDMKKVIVNNNLTQLIKISDLEYVLRHILRDLVKGQGYLPTKEIISKFRMLHPKEKDDQLVKDVIKDIKDGKYPVLTGPLTTDDCEDDVILIEKKYDVVTVGDSDDDDDDVTVTGEQEATPPILTKHYPVNSGLEAPGTADLGTIDCFWADIDIGPEKHELDKDKPTKLKPGIATHVPVVSGSTNLGPSELRPNPCPCNPAQVNSSLSNLGATEVPTNPTASRWNLLNPGSVKLDPNKPAHNPKPRSIQPGSTVFKHGTSKLVTANSDTSKPWLISRDSANSSAVVRLAPGTSKLVKANPDKSKLLVVNPGSANFSSTLVRPGPGTSQLVTVNTNNSNLRLVHPNKANSSAVVRPPPDTSKLVKANPDKPKLLVVNPGSANLSSTLVRPAPGTSQLVTVNTNNSKLRLVNPNKANSSAVVRPPPDTSKLIKANPDKPELLVVNPGSANLSSTLVRPAPGTSQLATVNTNNSKVRLVNPNKANSSAVVRPAPTSKLVTANPDTSKFRLVNQVNPGTSNIGPLYLSPPNLRPTHVSELRPTNPSTSRWDLIKPRSANLTPFTNLLEINTGSSNLAQAIPAPSNVNQVTSGPSNDTQVNLKTSNMSQVNPDPSNHDATELRPTNPRTSRWDLVNPSATAFRPKPGSSNALQVIPGLYDLGHVNFDPLNVARVNPEPTNRSTNFGSVSPGTCKFLPACLRPTELRPALATSKIRPGNPSLATGVVKTVSQTTKKANTGNTDNTGVMADTDKCMSHLKSNANENDTKTVMDDTEKANNSEDVKEKTGENNSNNLKVTAITIVTSLNELAAITDKTTDGPTMEVPIENIKEEIPFENSETELTDSSLEPAFNDSSRVTSTTEMANAEISKHNENKAIERPEDNSSNSLKVTAITILTSLNELTAISDKTTDRPKMEVPIEDIKEEIPFENSEETDPSLRLGHVTSLTEMDNTKNVKDYPNKATKKTEERNNNSLKVTAITIMTSLTELTAIADKTTDGSRTEIPIEDIKEEIQTENSETEQIDSTLKPASSYKSREVINRVKSYEEEKAMPKNIEETNNDQVDSSCGQGIGRIVQGISNNLELTTSEKRNGSQDKTVSDEEDETIESIVKYVHSLILDKNHH